MKKLLHIFVISILLKLNLNAQSFQTPYERSNATETATYQEAIDYFERLDRLYPELKLQTFGMTDAGKPLHLVIISVSRNFNPWSLRESGRNILLINNAIHPGEPDGVDASMLLARDLLQNPNHKSLLANTVICIIPFYNVGGTLNRGSYSRANQDGPLAYGFRGNAQNLDLNRDFTKCDSRNALSFTELFHKWKPDFYLENHVTNGADYQYTMTYLASQADKLGGSLGKYVRTYMLPQIELSMKARNQEICPYVNVFGTTPDQGFDQFLDIPRYSTGFAALFQTPGIIAEAHMLKPFKQRVKATYDLMMTLLEFMKVNGKQLRKYRLDAQKAVKEQVTFPLHWQVDHSKSSQLLFRGYQSDYKPSQISGKPRLYYDRNRPYTKRIPFYDTYLSNYSVEKPYAYIIPQAWRSVIKRLKANQVEMQILQNDTIIEVASYYIGRFETRSQPYEGHYLHSQTETAKRTQKVRLFKGDYVVLMNQYANRYLIEVLEPSATDSFFNWNFFDSILQQKEYFSPYIFEDLAIKILDKDPDLKQRFEDMKVSNPEFAENARQQLRFIYENSPYYEKEHRRYPIFRLEAAIELPLGEE